MICLYCPFPSTFNAPLFTRFSRCRSVIPRYASAVLKVTNRLPPRSVGSPSRQLGRWSLISPCLGGSGLLSTRLGSTFGLGSTVQVVSVLALHTLRDRFGRSGISFIGIRCRFAGDD